MGRDLLETCARCDASGGVMIEAVSVVLGTIIASVAACRRQRDPLWWRLSIPPIRNTVFADLIEDRPTGVIWHTQAETGRLIAMMAPVHAAKLEAAKRSGKRMVGGGYTGNWVTVRGRRRNGVGDQATRTSK